jgi:uncharacterized protein YeaO (DUF488 family)
MIRTDKTVYDNVSKSEGLRVLVMRFWPRGVRKDKIDLWMQALGTEKELIKKWKTGKITWGQFGREYMRGLKTTPDLSHDLEALGKERYFVSVLLQGRGPLSQIATRGRSKENN